MVTATLVAISCVLFVISMTQAALLREKRAEIRSLRKQLRAALNHW